MADMLTRLYQKGGTGMEPYLAEIIASFPVEKQIKTARVLKNQLTKRELQTLRLLATAMFPLRKSLQNYWCRSIRRVRISEEFIAN
jgi:hypothetical protein